MELVDAVVEELGLSAVLRPPRTSSRIRRPLSTKAIVLGYTILYFAGSLAWAARKMLWFDELFTYKIAQLRSCGEIWNAIRAGIECNPPLSFVLAHWSQNVFGVNAVATRLPAIAGYWLMSICLFAFVRRRTGPLCGFVAMLLPFFTIANFYITEARPYGMVLGATAAALLCWQSAADSKNRNLAVFGLGLSSVALVSLHYYAIYVPLAILAGEVVRFRKNRRLDLPVAVALILGLGSIVLWWPLLASARASSAHFWGAFGFEQLAAVFRDFSSPLWFAVLAAGLLLLKHRGGASDTTRLPPLPRHEVVVCTVLVAMPAVMFLAALWATNAYATRYVLPAVPGLAILAAFWLYRLREIAPKLTGFAAALFGVSFVGATLLNLCSLALVPDPQTAARAIYSFPTEPPLPIAVGSDDAFLRVRHYGDAGLASRCYYPTDMRAAARFYGVDTGERSLSEWSRFQPDNIVDYAKFVHDHPDFYAIRVSQHGWLLQKLAADGAQIVLLSSRKALTFEAEEQMYFRVHMPSK